MKSVNKKFFLIMAFLPLTLSGCYPGCFSDFQSFMGYKYEGWFTKINKKELPKRNPTTYIFNEKEESIRDILRNLWLGPEYFSPDIKPEPHFDKLSLQDSHYAVSEARRRNKSYDNPIGKNDVFYYCWGPIAKSRVYYSEKGLPLDYLAGFHLHLTAIEAKKTKVEVFTYFSKVINGKTSGLGDPHGPHNIYTDVDPTTIEEYQLLLRLGEILKEKNMPELILP